jgi:hypothetical protein
LGAWGHSSVWPTLVANASQRELWHYVHCCASRNLIDFSCRCVHTEIKNTFTHSLTLPHPPPTPPPTPMSCPRTHAALRPLDSLLHHPEPRWEDADGKMVRSTSCACVCMRAVRTLALQACVERGWCAQVQKNAGLKWCEVNDLTHAMISHTHTSYRRVASACIALARSGTNFLGCSISRSSTKKMLVNEKMLAEQVAPGAHTCSSPTSCSTLSSPRCVHTSSRGFILVYVCVCVRACVCVVVVTGSSSLKRKRSRSSSRRHT